MAREGRRQIMRGLLSLALVAGALAVPPANAFAKQIYVSPAGDDANSGGAANPVRTIGRGLELAVGGDELLVAGGIYPEFATSRSFAPPVAISGVEPLAPVVSGARLLGAQGLRIDRLGFTAPVIISNHPTIHAMQVAKDIAITRSDLTAPGAACLTIRAGSQNVLLEDSHVHGCTTGVGGPPQDAPSTGVALRRNIVEQLTGDGVQLGGWRDVTIEDNVIRDISDPAGVYHNDGIQFTGNDEDVAIRRNQILNSDDQLVFMQDALGPISRVVVENNVIAGAGAFAVQAQGVRGLRFINNTVWASHFGGLLLRQSHTKTFATRDAVVTNNILSGYGTLEGAGATLYDYNFLGVSGASSQPHGLAGPDPGFSNPSQGDYRLRPGAAALRRGSSSYAPATDITGMPRPKDAPSIGAYDIGVSAAAPPAASPAPATPTVAPPMAAPTGRVSARLLAHTRPRRVSRRPYRFVVSGAVRPTSPVARTLACRGTLSIIIKRGRQTVTRRAVPVGTNCVFRVRVKLRSFHPRRHGERLGVLVSFGGNSALLPKRAGRMVVRIG